jgi:prepilin-type processing-associated H-X9-DG protein
MLLPAVQSAREAARQAQCGSNLKQIGVALLSYHNMQSTFPPSSNWFGATTANFNPPTFPLPGPTWVISILPMLDQVALYQAFNLTSGTSIADPSNATGRGTRLPAMSCPSDAYNSRPFDGSNYGLGAGWARGNYAANASLEFGNSSGLVVIPTTTANFSTTPWSTAPLSSSGNWSRLQIYGGVMGANYALTLDQIRDGTSNTVLVAEVRAGVLSIDPRGTWALGGTPSALFAHGWNGDDNGPNASGYDPDDVFNCQDITSGFGGNTALQRINMACYCITGGHPNQQQTARSLHSGGIQSLFADGSVRFISNYIRTAPDQQSLIVTNSFPTLGVWDMINLSNDAQALPGGAF